MISIEEELKAAKAAKAAINVLLTTTPKSVRCCNAQQGQSCCNLKPVKRRSLNEARGNVGIALSNLLHGQPTPEKIDKAKVAVDAWINQLRT